MSESSENRLQYYKKSPCNNCPYRVDAPLALWSIKEYKKLLAYEKDFWGTVYNCHKKDGHVCVGFLMDQLSRDLPSIRLRIWLIKNKVSREYLDSLHCKSPLYDNVLQMCRANYPGAFKKEL